MQLPLEDGLFGLHRAYLPPVKHIDQQGFNYIVPVMGEGNTVATPGGGNLENPAAAETGAQETGIFTVDLAMGHRTDVRLFQHAVLNPGLDFLFDMDCILLSPGETKIDMDRSKGKFRDEDHR